MANDYKALPFKAEKEFHKVGDQNWVIIRNNDKSPTYTKPDRITLDGAKSFIGYVDGEVHYLLFQANETLVSCEGKPSLTKVSFGNFTDGKWIPDESGATAWKDTYEASNKWCALECTFPILKGFVKWLNKEKMIVRDLVYLNNLEVDEKKLFLALNALANSIVSGDDFEDNKENYEYLSNYGLEAIEFEEKLPKAKTKIPPVEGVGKNDDDFLIYGKVLFTTPSTKASNGQQRTFASEAARANSRLDFLIAAPEKVKQILNLYNSPLELAIALGLAGVEIDYSAIYNHYYSGQKTVVVVPTVEESSKLVSTDTPTPEPEKPAKTVKPGDLKELIENFGEAKVSKWISALDGLSSLGNPVSVKMAVDAAKTIAESDTYKAEPKNVLAWAKNNLKSVNGNSCRSIFDLEYSDLLTLSSAVAKADLEVKDKPDFSIVDLSIDHLEQPPF